MEIDKDIPNQRDCAKWIFNYSGCKFKPEIAGELWFKILQHKWFLSEKLGRDVGIKVACLDFVENVEAGKGDPRDEERIGLLKELDAQMVDRSVWDTISETQPPKQIVNRRIILPLTEPHLAHKHGVVPPRTIIFFGPPGTGKTHFVRAIAGALQWWNVEVSPSTLMAEGENCLGANLKRLMEKVRSLDEVVIFIDEFEEIAASRDHASRIDISITNEFLKQVGLLERQDRKILLVCATNYIRHLDAAVLRPGRFDCIIPVGGLDDQSRRIIFEHYLSRMNKGELDVDRIISMISFFTPADIEYLLHKISQEAFEREYIKGIDSRVTMEMFLEMIPKVRPTLTEEIIEEFTRDCAYYSRY
jgi:transitional endoplasmic reticulum ATPase